MNALERFANWFNKERLPVLDGNPPDVVVMEEGKAESILNYQGERDGHRWRITTAKLYERIK